MSQLQDFEKGYLEAMFWTEAEEISDDFGVIDLSKEDRATIENECIRFYQANKTLLAWCGTDFEQHGHDFWLTRNGHGVGFWDRGYKEEISKVLTKYCEDCKPAYLTSDDDGLYYHSEWVL